MNHSLPLILLNGTFAISRLDPGGPIPDWAQGEFVSVTRSPEELSVVCPEAAVPNGIRCERGWCCLRVAGTLDFALVGVLAAIVEPLAAVGISVFCISSFDTDYVLVKEADLQKAINALKRNGHRPAPNLAWPPEV